MTEYIEASDPLDLIQILQMAVENGASDIHLSAGHPPLARINSFLTPLHQTVLDTESVRDILYSALTEVQRSRFEETLELDFILEVDGIGRFRGNAHYAKGIPGATLRIIPNLVPQLEELGHLPSVSKISDFNSGLVLITGTTGSGKSTTLSSLVQDIASRRAGVIMTVEDPIEYVINSSLALVKQREIGHDTKSYMNALRHVLRQDPDVIIISEIRDRETMQAALTSAETGHLVISTLHTRDAPKAVDRIIDVFPSDQQNQIAAQLASTLRCVLSQTLIPQKENNTRILASELMFINDGIRTCIRDKKPHQILGMIEIGLKDGMHTIDHHLSQLIDSGKIDYDTALRYARAAENLPPRPKAKRKLFG